MFHPVHIAHQRFRKVCQVALAEVTQGKFTQPLRQMKACGLDLIIHQAIGSVVLLQVCQKRQKDKCDGQSDWQYSPGQGRAVRQSVHKAPHQQIQDSHTAHDYQIGNDGPGCASFSVF